MTSRVKIILYFHTILLIVWKYNITYMLYMADIVLKYNITYILYMAISHGIFSKVSILQYYYIVWKHNITYTLYMADIVWKYNITYVLYMAITHSIFFKVSILQYYYIVWKYNIIITLCFIWLSAMVYFSKCLYYNITILCGSTIQHTCFIWLILCGSTT